MNTRSKRASSVGILLPFILAPVLADGAIASGDRQHIAYTYSGIAAQASQSADGSSSGSATVTGVGASLAATAGTVSGAAATVTGVGAATSACAGTASGVATASGVSAAISATAGTSAGTATVTGVIQDGNNIEYPLSLHARGSYRHALALAGSVQASISLRGSRG